MDPLFQLLILTAIGSIAGLIGGVILLYNDKWAKKLTIIAVPLAAGVLLALSLLDLLPEAVRQIGDQAFAVVLIVFVVFFLIERFLFYLHHHYDVDDDDSHRGHEHATEEAIPLVIFGDTIHNFLDGVAIAVAFLVDPLFGLIVALATFLHETPHEIADFGILIAHGWSKQKAIFVNFLSALATFAGALMTYYWAETLGRGVGVLIAIAAGLFLYIAATDFLPEVGYSKKSSPLRQATALIVGILIIVALTLIVPDFHN